MAKPKAETNTPAAAVAVDAAAQDTKEETPVQSNTEKRMAEIVVPEYTTLPHLTTADIRLMPAKVAGVTAPAKRASVTDGEAKLSMIVLDSGRTLAQLENVVRVGLQSFIDAGEALLEIRARGLWKETGAKSFGQYAIAAFNISRPRIYQLVDVAQVAAILVNNGRALPSIGSRLNEFAPLKDDPTKLLEVADKVAATTPTGDLGEAPKGAIKDAVDVAQGKEPKAAAPAPVNGTNGGNLSGLNGGSAASAPTDEEIVAASNNATNGTPAPAPAVTRASPAALKADEKIAPQSLTTVLDALRTGAYVDNTSGATKAAIQKLAAMCLSYMAQDWAGAPPRVDPAYVVSIAQAKEIVRGLKKAQKVDGQAKAKAALSEEQAAQVEKNEAAVAASAPAAVVEAPVAPAPVEEETKLVANPTTAAEAYAILDASREWIEAGSKGKRPVTGTQVNRADALLQKLTEEADEESDESDEADDIAEAETEDAEEIDLGVVA